MFSSRSKGIHNHIQSLGIDEKGYIEDTSDSIIGHNDTRVASIMIVNLIRNNIFGGKCFIFYGPSGCGKTAMTIAISEELGSKIPVVCISGSEIYSSEVKKSEILERLLRQAILLRIKEYKNVYEGEITSIKDSVVDLRSLKGTKSLRLSKELLDQMHFQNCKIGDVIHVDSSSGILKRMGRGESHLNDYDLEAEKYVPLPKSDIFKKKEFFHEVSLHSLDMANVCPTGQDVLSLVHQIVKYKKPEVTNKLRNEVDNLIDSYKNAEIVYGVVIIEEAHMLDEECFSYLSKAMISPRCPTILLTTFTDRIKYIPNTFLQKCLTIKMLKNDKEEDILKRRIDKEKIEMDNEGFKSLLKICNINGIVYAINLLKMLKNVQGNISVKEVEDFAYMFKNK